MVAYVCVFNRLKSIMFIWPWVIGAAAVAIGTYVAKEIFGDDDDDKKKSTPLRTTSRNKKVFLTGNTGAGKSTILGTLLNKTISELKKNYPTNKEIKETIGNLDFIDFSGSENEIFKRVVEKIIDNLQSDDIILYVFDAMKNDKQNNYNIEYLIEVTKGKSLKLRIIGTRGAKVSNKQELINKIQGKAPNIKCEILELIDGANVESNREKILSLVES